MTLSDFSEIPVLDREQFDMLVETGEDEAAEMLGDLVSLFEEESGSQLQALMATAKQGDRERVARFAHALAGAAGNLGGLRLAQAARFVENHVQSFSADELNQAVVRIRELYDMTIQVFKREIAALA